MLAISIIDRSTIMSNQDFTGMGTVTKRQVSTPTTTQTQVPTQYEDDYGLPFYYNMPPSFAILMITIGVLLLLGQLLGPLILLFFASKQKKYMCKKCHRKFWREGRNPKVCDICGGEVIQIKNEGLHDKTDLSP